MNTDAKRASNRKWHKAHPDRKNSYRKNNRDKVRGWERTNYENNKERTRLKNKRSRLRRLAKRDAQADRPKPEVCDFCGENKPIVWDHDHSTMLWRSWPCRECNTVMGLVKDNPETLRKMADTIERHREKYKDKIQLQASPDCKKICE